METEKTLISRTSLAARWDFESPSTLINYEKEGIITRNPNFKKPMYYMEEIIEIERLKEINPLSWKERKKFEEKISKLEKKLEVSNRKLEIIEQALNISLEGGNY